MIGVPVGTGMFHCMSGVALGSLRIALNKVIGGLSAAVFGTVASTEVTLVV